MRKNRKDEKLRSGVTCRLVAQIACAALTAVAGCGLVTAASADDLQMIRNIGDGYKSVRVITHYDIHPEQRSFDLYAAEPAVPTGSKAVETEIASQTVHEICAGGRMRPGWTVRIFLPGDSVPAASCRAGGGHVRAPLSAR